MFKLLTPLGEVRFMLVESDSNDDTVSRLNAIKKTMSNFDFITLGNLQKQIPDRIERLIECRNIYVKQIRERQEFYSCDFVIVVDFDLKNSKLSTSNLKVSISRDLDWSGLFANQTKRYYDILALRHEFWCPNSVNAEMAWYGSVLEKESPKGISIFSRMIHIPTHLDPIEVDSAFGGLAIYRTQVFTEFDYSPSPKDDTSDIDHVILNRKIRNSGRILYIDPQLTNFGWNHHSLQTLFSYRILDNFIKKFNREKNRLGEIAGKWSKSN